ncbi:MAG TPA: isoprenylcysteine carboxylmethyltransferase family protein [Pyrinomonadaceae bacterium]|nr:isoprenylcysteine carboxylmethyltransferase family protein [Pyrinomonadaceae bacterium]
MSFEFLPTLVFVVVMICWFVFAGVFLLRKKPPSPPDQKREPASLFGVALQGMSYGLVWGVRRPTFTPISGNGPISMLTGLLAICAAVSSVWLITMAVKTLGKEWSLTARLVEGHQLATSGPYALVRHPIYSGMLGMLLATGLAISHWAALFAALIIFFIGTTIRVRSEEKLLREAFGEKFEAYARNVRAIVPGLY